MNVFDLAAVLTLNSSDYDQGLTKASGNAKKFAAGFGKTMKAGAVALGVLGAGTAIVGKKLIDGAKQTAQYGDNVDKMSQKIGISAEAYQKWDYVMERAGTSVDNLKLGMKTLSQQAEKNSSDFQKLGISQEKVASMSKEDLFEATVKGLSNMEEGTERTVLATKLLGRAGADLAPLLNQGSAAIDEQMDIAEKYGMVVPQATIEASAAFEDSMTTMNMTMEGFKNRMLGQLLPAMTEVTDGLGKLFAGDMSGVDDINKGLDDFINKAGEILPVVMEVGGRIVGNLVKGIMDKAPQLLQSALSMVTNITDGISKSLPTIIPSAASIVTQIISTLIQNAPTLIVAAVSILAAIGKGLIDSIPILLDSLPKIVSDMKKAFKSFDWATVGRVIVKGIASGIKGAVKLIKSGAKTVAKGAMKAVKDGFKNAPSLGTGFIKLLVKAVKGGVKLIKEAAKKIADGATDKIKEVWGDVTDVGKDLVEGIWKGISGAKKWIKDKISGWVGDVKGFLKGLFGISSPSKWARDVIGYNIVRGLAEGLEDNADLVEDSMTDLVTVPDIGTKSVGANADLFGMMKSVNMVNNVTVDGAENPEEFATRFVRQLKIDMRTA